MAGESLNADPATQGEAESSDRTVPLSALEAERDKRQKAERATAEANGRLAGYEAAQTTNGGQPPKSDAPQELTAAELRQSVDEGRLTQVEADGIQEKQLVRRVTADVGKTVRDEMTAGQVAERASNEIAGYKAAIPEIDEPDSPQHQKLQDEYKHLMDLGHAPGLATEAAAARAAFGSLDALRKVNGPAPRETYQETGGGSGAGDSGETGDGFLKDMPAKYREYCRGMIATGVLADVAAANKEFSYKGKHDPRARR